MFHPKYTASRPHRKYTFFFFSSCLLSLQWNTRHQLTKKFMDLWHLNNQKGSCLNHTAWLNYWAADMCTTGRTCTARDHLMFSLGEHEQTRRPNSVQRQHVLTECYAAADRADAQDCFHRVIRRPGSHYLSGLLVITRVFLLSFTLLRLTCTSFLLTNVFTVVQKHHFQQTGQETSLFGSSLSHFMHTRALLALIPLRFMDLLLTADCLSSLCFYY